MSNKFKELLARVPKETYDKVSKQMTCAYYFNGSDCSKGLPGTPCVLKGCVAWRLHPDFEKKVNTCRDCTFCKRVEGHPRRFFCQMKVQKYHTGTKCFVRLKDIACEDFIERDGIKELKLVLTYKWYDMIDSGEKPEEYRNRTTFYRRRLETGWSEPHLRWRKYDIVTFYRGYAKGRKTMSFKYGGCREGTGKEEWGAEPGKEYYVIKLGERIEHKNEPKLFEI